jgi:peptide/nickel transport system substrate-binding protein
MKFKRIFAAALTLSLALSLAACSGGDQKGPGASADPSANMGENGGGTFIVNMGADPTTFNPVLKGDDDGHLIYQNVFDGLLELNINSEVIPGLAESWDISDDGLVYTFHLAEGVKWHDGEPFTSADVKYTYERIMSDNGFNGATLSNALESIECPDDNTVVLNLKSADATLLGSLAWYEHFIIPKHIYENEADWATCEAATRKPIGTGAFKFVDYQQGSSITLEKNPDYFRGAPKVDRLIFSIIPDDATAVQAFKNGELDLLTGVPNSDVPAMQQDPEVKMGVMTAARRYQVICNMENETMSKWEVRKAVALGINREEISQKGTGGLQAPAYGFYPPFLDWAYNADADIGERDVAQAQQLLEQAGYTKDANGMYLTLTLDVFTGGTYGDCGKVMAANLKEVGIDLKVNIIEMAAWAEKIEAGNYELAMMAGFQGPDPDAMAKRIGTGAVMNYSKYSNAKVDELLAKGKVLVTHEDRGACYKEVQAILAEDLPIIPIVEFAQYYACRNNISGVPYIDNITDVHDSNYSKVVMN